MPFIHTIDLDIIFYFVTVGSTGTQRRRRYARNPKTRANRMETVAVAQIFNPPRLYTAAKI